MGAHVKTARLVWDSRRCAQRVFIVVLIDQQGRGGRLVHGGNMCGAMWVWRCEHTPNLIISMTRQHGTSCWALVGMGTSWVHPYIPGGFPGAPPGPPAILGGFPRDAPAVRKVGPKRAQNAQFWISCGSRFHPSCALPSHPDSTIGSPALGVEARPRPPEPKVPNVGSIVGPDVIHPAPSLAILWAPVDR